VQNLRSLSVGLRFWQPCIWRPLSSFCLKSRLRPFCRLLARQHTTQWCSYYLETPSTLQENPQPYGNPMEWHPKPRSNFRKSRSMRLTEEEIEAGKSPRGGFTRAQLEKWGVGWPPAKGWRRALVAGKPIPRQTIQHAKPKAIRQPSPSGRMWMRMICFGRLLSP